MFTSCVSGVLQYEEVEKLEVNEEYDKMIQVKEIESVNVSEVTIEDPKESLSKPSDPNKNQSLKPIKVKKQNRSDVAKQSKSKTSTKEKSKMDTSIERLPKIEDKEGFEGRRPIMDPFTPGESIELNIKYFAMNAGVVKLETLPFVEVNGKKSYHFKISIKSHSFFSRIYSVDDWSETFLDFETLRPYNLAVHIKESKQLKESRSVYDFENNEASFWEKKVTEDEGEKNKRLKWKIEPYSQNVMSSIFYLRNFTFKNGKKISFYIADAGKNIIFNAEVVRTESIDVLDKQTPCWVLRLEFEQDGVFKKTGDVFLWLTKDEFKRPVRIESKIKIGTLIGEIKSIKLPK